MLKNSGYSGLTIAWYEENSYQQVAVDSSVTAPANNHEALYAIVYTPGELKNFYRIGITKVAEWELPL